MVPEAAKKIQHAFISVNKTGVSDHQTLLHAYKELNTILTANEVQHPVIVIADGHASRFDESVLSFLNLSEMCLFILHADTSGGTQMHDQCNARLHALYDEKKHDLYNQLANFKRESFMNILAECWEEFATPTVLINAAKRVGISSEGLNEKWMNQAMFQRAAALLTPPTPMESSSASSASQSTFNLSSPSKEKNIRKYSVTWYQHKLKESQMEIDRLRNTPLSPDTVEGLMPMKKIEPKKSKNIRLTQTHGSMRVKDMLTKVHEKNAAEEEKQKKKDDVEKNKEEIRAAFDICKDSCICDGVCVVKGLKQCRSNKGPTK